MYIYISLTSDFLDLPISLVVFKNEYSLTTFLYQIQESLIMKNFSTKTTNILVCNSRFPLLTSRLFCGLSCSSGLFASSAVVFCWHVEVFFLCLSNSDPIGVHLCLSCHGPKRHNEGHFKECLLFVTRKHNLIIF